ncbi:hypothetical protein D7Y13_25775 [Corallococcus praedator]|uniref:Beta-ketoacyl synthase-like N-terminal domain-containing protein n=1 Tax=Corallococcus praedator TaxID=2316724 RepID=A0ABX9QEE9_9BACT|nr:MULTISPECIES: beta-ketoacyl synthase N-terminal-like domain-containing protein [Corallococcus]RKH16383.1 hypothetical protein D7X74_15570 [Corallococcus sp. CA047B]RKH34557.1 hypothetical protein D7X75_07620 [Corallococcus sp. CA031C]RKI01005.1 hypothetical protein D7Y13_25775 [Corallococcus praedator]
MRIEAIGMSSCLGPAVTACAAFRAGITRQQPSEAVTTFVPGDSEAQPVNVCAIPGITLGFSGVGRLVAITEDALGDLGAKTSLADLGREAGVFLALPDFADPGVAPQVRVATQEALGRQVLGRALAGQGVSWPEDRWRFFTGGSAGFALALAAARQELVRRTFDVVVVGGVDSLVDPEHLRFLLAERRLKSADNPVGLLAGEAGALLVLRKHSSGGISGMTPRVELLAVHTSVEQRALGAGAMPDGGALATCVQEVLRACPDQDVAFICDLNGEQRRAWEWGSALVRLKSLVPSLGDSPAWVPATGFGDVGAAMGAVGACLAVRAFERRHAPAHQLVIASQSDSGERAAFVLTAAGAPHAGGSR